jgi:(2Fe-2S) ferredoxin
MNDDKPFYEHHVFFCLNEREGKDCRPSCGKHGAEAAQKHAKQRIKELDLSGPGKVRINKAGCLDRCEEGPVVVIYPQGTWYTYVDNADIDDIIDTHLVGGKVVDRLKI